MSALTETDFGALNEGTEPFNLLPLGELYNQVIF